MPGLDPGIHARQAADCRITPGIDGSRKEHAVKIRDIEVFQVQWAPEDKPAQRSA